MLSPVMKNSWQASSLIASRLLLTDLMGCINALQAWPRLCLCPLVCTVACVVHGGKADLSLTASTKIVSQLLIWDLKAETCSAPQSQICCVAAYELIITACGTCFPRSSCRMQPGWCPADGDSASLKRPSEPGPHRGFAAAAADMGLSASHQQFHSLG